MFWKKIDGNNYAIMLAKNVELRLYYAYTKKQWESNIYLYIGEKCCRISDTIGADLFVDAAKEIAITKAQETIKELKNVLKKVSNKKVN